MSSIPRDRRAQGMGALAATLLAAAVPLGSGPARAAGEDGHGHEEVVFSQPLDEPAGTELTAVVVSYPPSGASPKHHHAGVVFAYVLSGSIRSENSATGPVRVYRAGESFFEPAGSIHLVSENASAEEPAKLLAVFVAPRGAQRTAMDP
jgi:quercetin dioxygenase-like cupin family protein